MTQRMILALFLTFLPCASVLALNGGAGEFEIEHEFVIETFTKAMEKKLQQGKADEVISSLTPVCASMDLFDAWRLLGKAYYAKGKYDEAIYCSVVASAIDPRKTDLAAWVQSALQGRAQPQLVQVPAFSTVLVSAGPVSTACVQAEGEAAYHKTTRFVVGQVGLDTAESFWGMSVFGVEAGKKAKVDWWCTVLNNSRIVGDERPRVPGLKILPPGFQVPEEKATP